MQFYTTIQAHVSAEIEEKKSRFIAQLFPVTTEEAVREHLDAVRSAHRLARHHCSAYILHEGGRARFSDDGEPAKTAGLPLYQVLQGAGLEDVLVVVTRYFGGILLGTGGLVRAYSTAAQAALAQAELLVCVKLIELRIRLEYSQYQSLLHLIEHSPAQIEDTQFTDAVELIIRCPAQDYPALELRLKDFLCTQEALNASEAFYAPFKLKELGE